jgi:hypothetical protein
MFGNTQMLRQHQKKTKYCLKIQETKAKEHEQILAKERAEDLLSKTYSADYFLSYPLKDRVLVLDYSNADVRFKDSFGELIDDRGAVALTSLIFDSLRVRNKELIIKYCTCLNDNFVDNGKEIVQLLDYRVAVERCADGNYVGDADGDFRTEFIEFVLGNI